MFNPDKAMRDTIFEILRNDGMSISALSRELKERGFNIHRLILTGYLRALTDMNELREKEVPPAKIYVPIRGKEQDIYEIIGEHSRNVCSGHDADLLILYALNKLFKRPVFLDELRHAGVRNPPDARQVEGDEKEEARRILSRAKLKVPDSNPAYVADAPAKQSHFEDLLSQIICDKFDFSFLIRETKQTKLIPDADL